jgi:phage major head subunit gpT-like protein
MSTTRTDIQDLILPGLKAEFSLAYRNEILSDTIGQFVTVINTTQPSQRYPLMDPAPMMREFLDERRPSGLSVHSMSIEDKVFESTISVDRRAIEDDQLDLIRLRVRELANRVAHHRHQMVVQLLLNGTETVGYDGAPLLSASHAIRGASFSNLSQSQLGDYSLKQATSQMMSIPDTEGVPLGIVPDVLLVGPMNMWTALQLVESDTSMTANGVSNVFKGRLKVIVSPFIAGNQWYLLDTKRPMRSVILQQRSDVPVEFSAMDRSTGSESAFMRDRYFYGVRARYNVGPGLWQTVFGSEATE